MKLYLVSLLLVVISMNAISQDNSFCVSILKDGQPEKVVAKFDSLYKPLGNIKLPDSISIGTAWYTHFRPAFLEHLKNANLEWDTTASAWVDLCCSPSGKIERVLYTVRGLKNSNGDLKFIEAVESFAKTYTFPISILTPYSQCGSFRFGKK